ncbi:MAG: TRAP transporter large permease subunit [Burkholderiales bacterium]
MAARVLPDPKALLANVATWGMGPIGVGFFIVAVFLVVGCFLDAIPAIIIVGTVLQPLADSVGMHPVSFAIISIVALAFGLVTRPTACASWCRAPSRRCRCASRSRTR